MICSDHPQSYSLPIKVFGQGRLPQPGQPGISIFDIQARIGQSSPEIHHFFPRILTLRQTIQSAWADTFLGTPRLNHDKEVAIDSCLRWFENELNPAVTPSIQRMPSSEAGRTKSVKWAEKIRFGDAPFSAQRVVLFLRAIVKKPDLVILDEAFSGMDDHVRDKCMLFLTWGETWYFVIDKDNQKKRFAFDNRKNLREEKVFEGLGQHQALICVSHVKEEVPGLVRDWIRLPEAGTGESVRFGRFAGPLESDEHGWEDVWIV